MPPKTSASISREYTRALNAVKLGRVFAKPFVGNLDGHRDAITSLGKHPQRLSWLYSGSCDGEVYSLITNIVSILLVKLILLIFQTVEIVGCIPSEACYNSSSP